MLADAQARAASPDVELALTAAPARGAACCPGAPTRVWRFTGRVVKGPRRHPAGDSRLLPGPGHPPRAAGSGCASGSATSSPSRPSCTGTGSTCPSWRTGIRAWPSSGGRRVRLRLRGHQPRRHLLVSPASAHAHGRAGLPGAGRDCCSCPIPRREALGLPVGDGRAAVRAAGPTLRRGQSARVRQRLGGGMGMGGGRGRGMGGMDRGMGRHGRRHGQMMETMNGWLGDRMLVNGRAAADARRRSPHLPRAAAERIERAHLQAGVERRHARAPSSAATAGCSNAPATLQRPDAGAGAARRRAARPVGARRRHPTCSCGASRSPAAARRPRRHDGRDVAGAAGRAARR